MHMVGRIWTVCLKYPRANAMERYSRLFQMVFLTSVFRIPISDGKDRHQNASPKSYFTTDQREKRMSAMDILPATKRVCYWSESDIASYVPVVRVHPRGHAIEYLSLQYICCFPMSLLACVDAKVTHMGAS